MCVCEREVLTKTNIQSSRFSVGEGFLQTTFLPTPDLEVECHGFAVDSKERTLLTMCNTTMGYPALTIAGLDDLSPIDNLRVIEYPSIPDIAELIVDNRKLLFSPLFSSLEIESHILLCHVLMLHVCFPFQVASVVYGLSSRSFEIFVFDSQAANYSLIRTIEASGHPILDHFLPGTFFERNHAHQLSPISIICTHNIIP